MIKLLINITELLKRLGFLAIFLLPCVGLVLVALAVFLVLIGIGMSFRIIVTALVTCLAKRHFIKSLSLEIRNSLMRNEKDIR